MPSPYDQPPRVSRPQHPSRHHAPRQTPHHRSPHTPQKPKNFNPYRRRNSSMIWVIGGSLAALVLVGGGVAAGIFLFGNSSSGKAPEVSAAAAADKQRKAVAVDALELTEIQTVAQSGQNDAKIKLPESVPEALEILERRQVRGALSPREIREKFAACEWLYGEPVVEEYRPRMARALGLLANDLANAPGAGGPSGSDLSGWLRSSTAPSEFKLRVSILRAFHRWGDSANAPLVVRNRVVFDSMTVYLLEVLEKYPSEGLMDYIVPYLKTPQTELALRVIRAIGEKSYSKLVPYLDGTDADLTRRIEELCAKDNIDPDKMRLQHYLAITNTSFGSDGGWAKVAGIRFNQEYQAMVIDGIRRFDRSKHIEVDYWLDACLVWGDQRVIPEVLSVFEDGWPFTMTKVIRFLREHPDSRSVGVLVDGLLHDWFSDEKAAAELIIHICNSGIEIDVKKEVHERVMRQLNDFANFNRDEMRDVLRETNFDYRLLVDKCLADLKNSSFGDTRSSYAIDALAQMEVIEEMRYEVAEVLANYYRSQTFGKFESPVAFLRWATPKNDYIYDLLEPDFFQKNSYGTQIVTDALRIAIKGDPQRVVLPIARSLDDNGFMKTADGAMDALIALGPEGEDLCLLLLNSSSPFVLANTCGVLGIIGTSKSIEPLKAIYTTAKRVKNQQVADAANRAAGMINSRIGVVPQEDQKK